MTHIRVVLIEDHPLVRAGLRTSLHAAGIDVVAEVADGLAAADAIAKHQPDVTVMDLGLPGKDGVALTREVKHADDSARVVILTMQEREEEVLAALGAGADAYCVKSSKPDVVIDAIRTVAGGGAYFDSRIAHIVLRRLTGSPSKPSPSPLTARETEILSLIAQGVSNAEIADRLQLSLGTVKGHVADILLKLSASDRTQAAVSAFRRGLIG